MFSTWFRAPLRIKFLVVVLIASLVPIALAGNFLVGQATDTGLRNVADYLQARGQQQVQVIENNVTQAVLALNQFLLDPALAEVLRAPLIAGNTGRETAVLREAFDNRLMPTEYYNGLWLLAEPQGALALRLAENDSAKIVPLSPQLPTVVAITDISRQLTLLKQQQTLTVVNSVNTLHVVVITALQSAGDAEPIGFLVAELNLERLVRPALDDSVGTLPAYSFFIYPDGSTVITTTGREAAVDVTSVAVQRVRSTRLSGVDVYDIETQGQPQTVVGFYAPVTLADNTFILVTEINDEVVQARLLSILQIGLVPYLALLIVLAIVLVVLLNRTVVPPLQDLGQAIQAMIRGDFEAPLAALDRGDEIGQTTRQFAEMRQELDRLLRTTNDRLANRTRDVQIIQTISESILNETNLDDLLNRVVDLIVEKFPTIYHAQIFLLDQDGAYAVLRASTGASGRALLERGHRLPVGSVSVIGQVTEQGKAITARDIAQSNVHRTNEFLPETRAELAIPMRLAGRVIGALDVQSKQRDSFNADQEAALKTLADQIAIAIENVRLYSEYQRLLNTTQQARREGTRRAWQEVLLDNRQSALIRVAGNETRYDFSTLRSEAIRQRKTIIGEPTTRNTIPFVVPIQIQEQVLGVIEYEIAKLSFTQDKVALAEELSSRLAISLESARLLQSNRQVAEREQVVNAVTARLSGQTDMDAVLRIALDEIRQVLRTPQVTIRVQPTPRRNGIAPGTALPRDNDPSSSSE